MKAFIPEKSNSQCPNITENKASNYKTVEMDVVSVEVFDKPTRVVSLMCIN